MKKIFLTISLLFSLNMIAQNTTKQELDYMNKGLNIQLSSGLDMKKGYKISQLFYSDRHSGNLYFAFSLLLRDNNEIAGIIVWTYNAKDKTKIVRFGLPYNTFNKDIIKEHTGLFYNYYLSSFMEKTDYSYAIGQILPNLLSAYYSNSLKMLDE